MLCLSNACLYDKLCSNKQACAEIFWHVYEKKNYFICRKRKFLTDYSWFGSNISQTQGPLSFVFDVAVFYFSRASFYAGFHVSNFPLGGFFICFWGSFGIICVFLAFFAKCLLQKCEYVLPEHCMFT